MAWFRPLSKIIIRKKYWWIHEQKPMRKPWKRVRWLSSSRTKNRLWTKEKKAKLSARGFGKRLTHDNDTLLIMVHPKVLSHKVQILAGETRMSRTSCFERVAGFHRPSPSGNAGEIVHHRFIQFGSQQDGTKGSCETILKACNGTDERLIYEGWPALPLDCAAYLQRLPHWKTWPVNWKSVTVPPGKNTNHEIWKNNHSFLTST